MSTATVKKARVHLDYHVEYDRHYYSVPYQLVREEVMVHAGDTLVAIFHQGRQVAVHPRSHQAGWSHHGRTTYGQGPPQTPGMVTATLPQLGGQQSASTPKTLSNISWKVGGIRSTATAPVSGYLTSARNYGKDRLEAACHRATHIGGMHYKNIASILSNSMDKVPFDPADAESQTTLPLMHDNVRGSDYYH